MALTREEAKRILDAVRDDPTAADFPLIRAALVASGDIGKWRYHAPALDAWQFRVSTNSGEAQPGR